MKEREEMWQKIEELARLNPQVCNSRIWDRQNKNVLGELGLLPELMRAGCSTWSQSCAHSAVLSLSGCVLPVWTSAVLTLDYAGQGVCICGLLSWLWLHMQFAVARLGATGKNG